MAYQKYHSIENLRDSDITGVLSTPNLAEAKYSVTEKAHGACFSLHHMVGGITEAYRRNGKLDVAAKDFYPGWQGVYQEVLDRMPAVTDLLRLDYYDITSFTIYGELLGGHYPGLPTAEGQHAIQRGIWYSPKVTFLAFDILVYQSHAHSNSIPQFLPYERIEYICKRTGILAIPQLAFGSFNECVAHTETFQSRIPALLGLPELEDNIAEGWVIRCEDPNLTYGKHHRRPIWKQKTAKFAEVAKDPRIRPKTTLTAEEGEEIVRLLARINQNRLNSVISKGDIPMIKQNTGRIIHTLVADALEELAREDPEEPHIQEPAKMAMYREARNVILKWFEMNSAELVEK